MKECLVCFHWKPKKWDTWRWVDEAALCSFHKIEVHRTHCCPHYSLTKACYIDDGEVYAGGTEEARPEPTPIKVYAHQEEAFERFKDKKEIALFFEQGLGKTNVALRIAAYKYNKKEIDALLVIAPNGVHKQWYMEQIPLWLNCPYEAQLLGGKAGKASKPFYKKDALHVVVVNVDTFSTPKKWEDITEWANHKNTFIVLDEATTIKSIKAQRTQRILYAFNKVTRRGKSILSSVVLSKARAVLTGTPVTEGPFDLWSIFEFLRPGYFSRNYYSFQNYYGLFYTMTISQNGQVNTFPAPIKENIWKSIKECKNYGEAYSCFGVTENTYKNVLSQNEYVGPYCHADELKKLIAPVSIFKSLEECVDMPGKTYERKMLDMTPDQTRLYQEMEYDLLTQYEMFESKASSKMVAYIRLQQITSGFISAMPILDEDSDIIPNREIVWIGNSNPKLDLMYSLIETEIATCPVIIITRFTAEAARIFDDLSKKMSCMLYTGWKKVGNVEDFQQGKFDVLIANERAISRGFNLQISHTTHFYSNLFSLEDRLQTESRTYRIGQGKRVRYTDYLYLDTIDMKIIAALRQKRNLLDYMRGVSIKDFLTSWDEVAEIEYGDLRGRL